MLDFKKRFTKVASLKISSDDIKGTVGAGDALFSAFLHYHSKGYCSLEALKRAQIFASAKITANGGAAGFVTEAQIEEYYCRYAAEMKPF